MGVTTEFAAVPTPGPANPILATIGMASVPLDTTALFKCVGIQWHCFVQQAFLCLSNLN